MRAAFVLRPGRRSRATSQVPLERHAHLARCSDLVRCGDARGLHRTSLHIDHLRRSGSAGSQEGHVTAGTSPLGRHRWSSALPGIRRGCGGGRTRGDRPMVHIVNLSATISSRPLGLLLAWRENRGPAQRPASRAGAETASKAVRRQQDMCISPGQDRPARGAGLSAAARTLSDPAAALAQTVATGRTRAAQSTAGGVTVAGARTTGTSR